MAERRYEMCLEENRLASFVNWPYEDTGKEDICTAKRMAEAGFYSCATDTCPDLVKCYVCYKELEGWDATDNPWTEHKSHSANCPFAKKGKPQAQLTVEEFVKMEMASQQNKVVQDLREKVKNVETVSDHVRNELLKLATC